ncbi:MAG TPA: nuclear transport factor 2 family protein [Ktedonobacteraceae bacterium]|jgi:predicted ester cyclase|nr:nuclear transport factor 2 family protein [Ktedonobacteraceae bacterium]
MNQTETVQTLLSAIEREEWAEAASYLTSDFTFSGAVPQPISGQEWLGIHKAFAAAYSNFSFNYQPGDEEGQQVHCSVQLTGKHTRDLRLPIPGIPAIPPTGKQVSLPRESLMYTFRDGKVADLHVTSVEGGGLPGMLQQLGVALPTR